MAIDPAFAATPRSSSGLLSTANTNRDGSGTLVDLFTAGTVGSKISEVNITAIATTTAGMVRLYIYDGTNNRLLKEIPVSAVTPSGTVAAWAATPWEPSHLVLPANYKLKGSTHQAESFHAIVFGADF
jgi:hypothetical protein